MHSEQTNGYFFFCYTAIEQVIISENVFVAFRSVSYQKYDCLRRKFPIAEFMLAWLCLTLTFFIVSSQYIQIAKY